MRVILLHNSSSRNNDTTDLISMPLFVSLDEDAKALKKSDEKMFLSTAKSNSLAVQDLLPGQPVEAGVL